MRVNHLSLSHFRGFQELEIDFSATNLTVFIGTNGRGKSSILDLIAAHLHFFTLKVTPDKNKKILITAKDINNNSGKLQSEITFSIPSKGTLKSKESLKISNILFLSNTSLKSTEITATSRKFDNFCVNIYQSIIKDFSIAIPILAYYQANRTVGSKISLSTRIDTENKGNKQRAIPYSTPQLNAYYNAFSKEQNNFDAFFQWFKIEEDKENESIRREKNFDIRNPQLEVIRLTVAQFFSFLSGDKYTNLRIERGNNLQNKDSISNNDTAFIIDKNNEKLSLEQLSDGEKGILLLICDIARRLAIANPIEKNGDFSTVLKNGNGIVLIDEIDLHLHPLWQKEILQALVKTFPSLQFIVTTHSPYVVTHLDLDDKQVQVYSIEKDKVVPIQSKGKDLSTASFEIFGVERRPKMYQYAIDDLFREFEAEKPNLALLDKKFLALKKQLGETDPEVESAKIIIEGLKL